MALSLKPLVLILALLLGISTAFAQGGFSNELGIIAGPVAFQSDFGERRNFETNSGNTGFGIGIVHFMNFEYTSGYSTYSYFKDHFKVRSELSYNKTKLKHFGQWVDASKTKVNAQKLRAHSGESNNIDIGMQLEYFPFSLKEFSYSRFTFAPFISFGIHITSYNPKVFTTFGDGDPNNLDNFYGPWYKFSDGSIRDTEFVTSKSGIAPSIVGSIGTRVKVSFLSDVLIDLRWQRYFNDDIDGLNHKLPSNKASDYLLWLNVGYVYYFN